MGFEVFGFWCFLLLKTNYKSGWFMGTEIQPGQFATSYRSLADQTGTSIKRCRHYLDALVNFDMIKKENKANRFTIISICKWDTYQSLLNESGQTEGTTEGTTEGKPRANQGQQSKKEKKEKNTYLSDFETFWDAYPKKKSKGAAEQIWKKLPTDILPKILEALEWQKRASAWTKENGQYIPYPASYLNDRGWEDEPISIPKKSGNYIP